MQLLKNHTTPDSAYVVDDYPYGFRLRCKIRYWLEFKAGKGFRFVSQTTNPKRAGEHWNKPKASTYCRFGGAMFLDDNGHVQWAGLTEYSTAAEARKFLDTYGDAIPEQAAGLTRKWVAAKTAYEANRNKDDALHVGVTEGVKAFAEEQ